MRTTPQTFLRFIAGAAIAAAVLFLVWYFRSIVVYVLISAVLAVMGNPLVKRLAALHVKGWKVPRWLAALATLIVIWVVLATLCSLFVPLVFNKIYQLSNVDFATVVASIEEPIARAQSYLHEFFAMPESTFSLSEALASALKQVIDIESLNTVFASIVNVVLSSVIAIFSITFITFFFLRDEGLFYAMITAMFPERYHENITRALDSVTLLLARYFTGILSESLLLMVAVSLTMMAFGMKAADAAFIGLGMGVMNVVPYAGPLIGGVVSVFVGIVTPIGGMTVGHTAVVIIGSLLILKGLDDFVLQPTLYSSRVKAHPLEIFLVILIAGSLAGILGMLLAIPSYTVLRVFAKEFFSQFSLVRKLTEKVIIEGVVEHGRRLGRELGFPTANVAVPDSVAAEDGVYRSRAEVDGAVYDAMSNLGRNPSVGGTARRLETHIFGFSGALYGRMLRVELLEKIRDERRFDTLEELRAQIEKDREYILKLK